MTDKELYDLVYGAYTKASRMNWIPCSEMVPITIGYYLTSDKYGVTITRWTGKGWERTKTIYVTEYGRAEKKEEPIIAWMPLPKKYEEE